MSKQKRHRKSTRARQSAWAIATVIGIGLLLIAGATIWWSDPPLSPAQADVVVYKRANCSCCNKWVSHLQDSGLIVSVQNVRDTREIQQALGVPDELRACHTATVGDRWVEGHVPADLIYRLINEDPDDVRGLAVAGMPIGSPGMEGPNPQTYEVLRVTPEGQVDRYAEREGAVSPP